MRDRLANYEGTSFDHKDTPQGCTAIPRNASRLQIDIDSDVIPDLFFERLEKLKEFAAVEQVMRWSSKSGNIHLEIYLDKPIGDMEAAFLQLFLGSDHIREYLSFRRSLANISPAIQLFKPHSSKASEL